MILSSGGGNTTSYRPQPIDRITPLGDFREDYPMLTRENLATFRAKVASMADEGMGLALAFTFKGQSYVGITSAVILSEAIEDDYNAERLLREHDGIRMRQIDVVDGSKICRSSASPSSFFATPTLCRTISIGKRLKLSPPTASPLTPATARPLTATIMTLS